MVDAQALPLSAIPKIATSRPRLSSSNSLVILNYIEIIVVVFYNFSILAYDGVDALSRCSFPSINENALGCLRYICVCTM